MTSLASAAPWRTWNAHSRVHRPIIPVWTEKKERDRAHHAEMATPEERLLLQRAAKIARQRANYHEKRQALLDAFPFLAQRKVSLHRAGASCQTLDSWRHDSTWTSAGPPI